METVKGSQDHLKECYKYLHQAELQVYLAFQAYAKGEDLHMDSTEHSMMENEVDYLGKKLDKVLKIYEMYKSLVGIKRDSDEISEGVKCYQNGGKEAREAYSNFRKM